jgi:hypothetical protein
MIIISYLFFVAAICRSCFLQSRHCVETRQQKTSESQQLSDSKTAESTVSLGAAQKYESGHLIVRCMSFIYQSVLRNVSTLAAH